MEIINREGKELETVLESVCNEYNITQYYILFKVKR